MESPQGIDDNDIRGWIMTIVSGIACVVGSSIICVDLLLRHIPRYKSFSIQDSSTFLASSMSLSFGVMIFSALYNMLPSSQKYLLRAGYTPSQAGWMLLGCFLAGFIGIQILSRFLHHYMPSHVVDCDHTHSETPASASIHTSHGAPTIYNHGHGHAHAHSLPPSHSHSRRESSGPNGSKTNEQTPLLVGGRIRGRSLEQRGVDEQPPNRRPSMAQMPSRVFSFVTDSKTNCDEAGPCYGYSEPCGRECFKHFISTRANSLLRAPTFSRRPLLQTTLDEEAELGGDGSASTNVGTEPTSPCCKSRPHSHTSHHSHHHHDSHHDINRRPSTASTCSSDASCNMSEAEEAHHHHVPENAFLSLSLQTSIAIALHKLPEGFITYATNHASPALGFSIFMALFIHNITEGFAMALPLYLALGSRFRAIAWSSLLGGVSQPLGAGIAALWFWASGKSNHGQEEGGPGEAVYGAMFAVTAGIMVSVALQLFVEATGMCHRKEVCVASAVVGMALLAGSGALTA